MALKRCPSCRVDLAVDARVCPKCGWLFARQVGSTKRDVRRHIAVVIAAAALSGAVLAWLLAR